MPSFALSSAQIEQVHTQGYLSPLTLCSPDEMAVIRARIDREVLDTSPAHAPGRSTMSRHMDHAFLRELLMRPQLVDPMRSLLGPDLVGWNTNFWCKQPGDGETLWHQDIAYWPIEPWVNMSAWIAIDPALPANGCVQVIPGSHRRIYPHLRKEGGWKLSQEADRREFDERDAVDLVLEPGQFALFNERCLHHADPNTSTMRRCGFTVRVTVPFVRILHDQAPLFPGHRALLLAGEDRFGWNRYVEEPALQPS